MNRICWTFYRFEADAILAGMIDRRVFVGATVGFAACDRQTLVSMDTLAERYVKLVLALGVHDADYVDAFYGPPAWKTEAAERKLPVDDIRQAAASLAAEIAKLPAPPDSDELAVLRQRYLLTQTRSIVARAEMMAGKVYSFDEESSALYDATAPRVSTADFDKTLAELEHLVTGHGALGVRLTEWRKQFQIAPAKLDAAFKAAIDEARARTKRHIKLPDNESFTVEYVTKQVWSAYNWYKGDSESLIQVNTDLPVEANRVLHLACHEGYPGHHVYNALLEEQLVRKRKWVEYCVYPLYSPQSLIAEGSADYGLELAFPAPDRADFLASRIFPLAGLDAAKVALYLQVTSLTDSLDHVTNMAARRYIDKEISAQQCQELLEHYALQSPERAAQRVRFIDKNRSYVINYNVGEDLIRAHMVARHAAGSDAKAWKEFEALLSSPRLPSGLSR